MTQSLKRKTFHALLWSFADRFGQQFIQFAISIVLARLLLPEEFGLIGMLTIFMAIAQIFMDSGFGSALIQKKNADHLDECSIFYFNIFSGVILTALLCAVAPWIAAFYEHDELTTLTQFLALRFLIAPFSSIQSTLLLKKLDFKSIVTIGLISQIVTGAVGIVLAYRGWGVWSLAIQSVSSSFLGCALLWYFNPWRPSLIFSFASLRSMFSYGSRLLASTLLDQLFAEIYTVVIGKVYSAADLGYYTRARGWQRLTSQSLSSVVGRVTFPAFASISDDPPRFKRGLKKSIVFLGFVNFPMMLGLAATAESGAAQAPAMAGPCGSCGHPDGPGACHLQ